MNATGEPAAYAQSKKREHHNRHAGVTTARERLEVLKKAARLKE